MIATTSYFNATDRISSSLCIEKWKNIFLPIIELPCHTTVYIYFACKRKYQFDVEYCRYFGIYRVKTDFPQYYFLDWHVFVSKAKILCGEEMACISCMYNSTQNNLLLV